MLCRLKVLYNKKAPRARSAVTVVEVVSHRCPNLNLRSGDGMCI